MKEINKRGINHFYSAIKAVLHFLNLCVPTLNKEYKNFTTYSHVGICKYNEKRDIAIINLLLHNINVSSFYIVNLYADSIIVILLNKILDVRLGCFLLFFFARLFYDTFSLL